MTALLRELAEILIERLNDRAAALGQLHLESDQPVSPGTWRPRGRLAWRKIITTDETSQGD